MSLEALAYAVSLDSDPESPLCSPSIVPSPDAGPSKRVDCDFTQRSHEDPTDEDTDTDQEPPVSQVFRVTPTTLTNKANLILTGSFWVLR